MPKKRLVVGLMAHVDAGKTTLAEALLYRAGCLKRAGRVDRRDTFLDTGALERERGITILSKAAILPLPTAEITLLDTPGHVDFAAEAERVLQVLDCAVLVLSAPDGVQSHTVTLWRLLARYRVPTLLFVNKTDLPAPARAELLETLRARLGEGCVDFTPLYEAAEAGAADTAGANAAAQAGAPANRPAAQAPLSPLDDPAAPPPDGAAPLTPAASPALDALYEALALTDEAAMEEQLACGALSPATLARLFAERRAFPCLFGAALRGQGVGALLDALQRLPRMPDYGPAFAARVFKISRDAAGARLSWLKVTGGSLKVKTALSGEDARGPWQEKADALRLYSGEKFRLLPEAPAGTVCAVAGLSRTWPGQGLGAAGAAAAPLLRPVMSYQLLLTPGQDPHAALEQLMQLEEEDPALQLEWLPARREIRLQLMGQVQLEVLARQIKDRFGLTVGFGPGQVLYAETLAAPVVGVGHFEPLRHYAEVQLLLEPGAPGSGLRFASRCSEDALAAAWQHQILEALAGCRHRGVLTGAPLTDLAITLVAGRGHLKHTEGGDFRQAACRAVRQGLMQARAQNACRLLEPWQRYEAELPSAAIGRALMEIGRLGGETEPPEPLPAAPGEPAMTRLCGAAPAAGLRGFAESLPALTGGQGRILCTPAGHRPCAAEAATKAIAASGYDPARDTEQPADSVFCSHGAGVLIPWDEAPARMHLPPADLAALLGDRDGPDTPLAPPPPAGREREKAKNAPRPGSLEEDAELKAIFERTYGAGTASQRRSAPGALKREQALARAARAEEAAKAAAAEQASAAAGDAPAGKSAPANPAGPGSAQPAGTPAAGATDYLLVDGYNIIFAWDELKALAAAGLDTARAALIDLLCNYRGFVQSEVILVFDAYRVAGGAQRIERVHNIEVVYTREAETADQYIERATYELGRRAGPPGRVRVATSDGAEQMIILGHGALRLPARAFHAEVEAVNGRIAELLRQNNRALYQRLPLPPPEP